MPGPRRRRAEPPERCDRIDRLDAGTQVLLVASEDDAKNAGGQLGWRPVDSLGFDPEVTGQLRDVEVRLDELQPTDNLNPEDLTEFFFRPELERKIGVPGGTISFLSPPLYLTVRVRPSVPVTIVSTVAFVIVLLGRESQGPKPSAKPRCASRKI